MQAWKYYYREEKVKHISNFVCEESWVEAMQEPNASKVKSTLSHESTSSQTWVKPIFFLFFLILFQKKL